jgi:hypothetical protein
MWLRKNVKNPTDLDEYFVEAEVVPDGVLEAGLVGEEDGVARQDPLVDLRQLHPLVRAAHDGGHDQVLVRHLNSNNNKNNPFFHSKMRCSF